MWRDRTSPSLIKDRPKVDLAKEREAMRAKYLAPIMPSLPRIQELTLGERERLFVVNMTQSYEDLMRATRVPVKVLEAPVNRMMTPTAPVTVQCRCGKTRRNQKGTLTRHLCLPALDGKLPPEGMRADHQRLGLNALKNQVRYRLNGDAS